MVFLPVLGMLLDYAVGAEDDRRRNLDPYQVRRSLVDDQLERRLRAGAWARANGATTSVTASMTVKKDVIAAQYRASLLLMRAERTADVRAW